MYFAEVSAQNLFANPGFEDINTCTEYHASCAPEAWYYIQPTTNPLVNNKVVPKPLLGVNLLLVPVDNVYDKGSSRYYVYTMLACPLLAGEQYKLSFYINTSTVKFDHLDFYFSSREPSELYFSTNHILPSFSITAGNIIADLKQGWKAVEYFYTATGDEKFCMLGNMSERINYDMDQKMSRSGNIYYFIDEIKLASVTNRPLCPGYNSNISKMYAQDRRHTEHALIDTFIEVKKPAPVFVTDTITVPAVFFETGSSVLKPAFRIVMDSMIHVLATKHIAKIDVVGHTDSKGTIERNLQLSLARATAVRNFLVSKLPQYTDNCFVYGKGQEQPVADNNTEQGRIRNRRVEIILTITELNE